MSKDENKSLLKQTPAVKFEGEAIEDLKKRADLLVKSGLLPKAIKTPEAAIAIMLMGAEYGISPMKSFQCINIIEGKPALSSQLMLALCERTGELVDKKFDHYETYAAFTITRKGQTPYRATFGDTDAQLARTKEAQYDAKGNWVSSKVIPLIEKYNYKTMKKDMYMARAISRACRRVFPDAVLGLIVEDEAYDVIEASTEAIETKKTVIADAAADKTAQIESELHTGSIHDSSAEMEFINKINASFIQDPVLYKFYADQTIGEIYKDQTPGGDPKGIKFLERVSLESSNPDDRANLAKYLQLMAAEQK